jgi:AraC-like DNA-binding protein
MPDRYHERMNAKAQPRSAVRNDGWIVRAPGDLERIEARFAGVAFAPHRHDTYAFAVTLEGVQSFDYRGSTRHSLPGQLVVLHPDELHDGRAGDGTVFRYRSAHVAPAHLQDALGGRPLPFLDGGVSSDPRLLPAVLALVEDFERPLAGLEQQDAIYDVARALQAIAGDARPINSVNRRAALRAREYVDAHAGESFSLEDLERATGHDRWQLSRDFRALFGTSPYRYLIARRLDRARRLMLDGCACADAACACGFADQSHLGRAFKKTFGLTPNAWLRAAGFSHDRSIPPARARRH